jgi:hypothetical protein
LFVDADIDKLRQFVRMLTPVDLSQIKLVDDVLGGMPEAEDPNQFIYAWAPHVAGFADDLLRGVKAFQTVAGNAADSIHGVDVRSAGIFAKEISAFRGQQPSESGVMSRLPQTRPLENPQPPPSPAPAPPSAEPLTVANVGVAWWTGKTHE